MGYGDYSWGLYRYYYKDPFHHSLLSTRQLRGTMGFDHKVPFSGVLWESIIGFPLRGTMGTRQERLLGFQGYGEGTGGKGRDDQNSADELRLFERVCRKLSPSSV